MNGYRTGHWFRAAAPVARWVVIAMAFMHVATQRSRADEPAPTAAPPAESAAASTPESASAPAVDSARLKELVANLDDDRYASREAAQKELIALGAPTLDAVAEVAARGSLESATRAVNILLGWADLKDEALSTAALERLAKLETRPVEAAMAYERLASVREAAAMEAIKELGGRFDYDQSPAMIAGSARSMQVIIGPQWKGGAEGLRHVADIRSASTLSLHSAPVGDEAAPTIASLAQLRRIEIFGTNMTPEAVQKLQPQLPNTQLDFRGGARLGIAGLVIQRIVPDSPAAKAGLQQNDRIMEFDGNEIKDFDALTALIAKCKPGDTVKIKVKRGDQELEKSVTFDRWGDDPRTTINSPELRQGMPLQFQVQGGQGGQIIIRNAPVLPLQPIPAPAPEQRR